MSIRDVMLAGMLGVAAGSEVEARGSDMTDYQAAQQEMRIASDAYARTISESAEYEPLSTPVKVGIDYAAKLSLERQGFALLYNDEQHVIGVAGVSNPDRKITWDQVTRYRALNRDNVSEQMTQTPVQVRIEVIQGADRFKSSDDSARIGIYYNEGGVKVIIISNGTIQSIVDLEPLSNDPARHRPNDL